MTKFVAFLIFASCALLLVEAGIFRKYPWTEIEEYAASHNDQQGQSLVEWLEKDFKSGAKDGQHDKKVMKFLGVISKYLSLSGPEDCDDEHLAAMKKFQAHCNGRPILNKIFKNKLDDYSEQCRLKVVKRYNEVAKQIGSSKIDIIEVFAKNVLKPDYSALKETTGNFDFTGITKLYSNSKNKFDGIEKDKLKSACADYEASIKLIFADFMKFKVDCQDFKLHNPQLAESDDVRVIYASSVLCNNYLHNVE